MKIPDSSCILDEEWFNLGKADAWAKRPKQPPSQNSLAARTAHAFELRSNVVSSSLYDLGYSEGTIERPPSDNRSTS